MRNVEMNNLSIILFLRLVLFLLNMYAHRKKTDGENTIMHLLREASRSKALKNNV